MNSFSFFLHRTSLFVPPVCRSRPVSIVELSAMNCSHTPEWRAVDCTNLQGDQAVCFSFFLAKACFMHELGNLRRQRKCSQIFVFHPRLPAPVPPLQSHHYLSPLVQVNVPARHTPPPWDGHTHLSQGRDQIVCTTACVGLVKARNCSEEE